MLFLGEVWYNTTRKRIFCFICKKMRLLHSKHIGARSKGAMLEVSFESTKSIFQLEKVLQNPMKLHIGVGNKQKTLLNWLAFTATR